KCPMCKARIAVPAGGGGARVARAAEPEERSSGGGRTVIALAIMACVVLFLVIGAGLGPYVLAANNSTTGREVARNDDKQKTGTQTAPPTPGRGPELAERPTDPAPGPTVPPAPVERPTEPPAKDPEKPIDAETAKQLKINAAIDKGIVFLKKE